ncbi:GTP-binding protein Rho1 [Irineochytrium annulatum]|nr:GTP-binding protein Rho1 [Irineochytrium annulatum]
MSEQANLAEPSSAAAVLDLASPKAPAARKFVVVGDEACGKTSLLRVFTGASFPEEYVPTVSDTYAFQPPGETERMELVDTTGSEVMDRLRPLSYEGADLWIVCFSVEDRHSLFSVTERWVPEVRYFNNTIPLILVACKTDLREDPATLDRLERAGQLPVTLEEGQEVAYRIGAFKYVETSAKVGFQVLSLLDDEVDDAGEFEDVEEEEPVDRDEEEGKPATEEGNAELSNTATTSTTEFLTATTSSSNAVSSAALTVSTAAPPLPSAIRTPSRPPRPTSVTVDSRGIKVDGTAPPRTGARRVGTTPTGGGTASWATGRGVGVGLRRSGSASSGSSTSDASSVASVSVRSVRSVRKAGGGRATSPVGEGPSIAEGLPKGAPPEEVMKTDAVVVEQMEETAVAEAAVEVVKNLEVVEISKVEEAATKAEEVVVADAATKPESKMEPPAPTANEVAEPAKPQPAPAFEKAESTVYEEVRPAPSRAPQTVAPAAPVGAGGKGRSGGGGGPGSGEPRRREEREDAGCKCTIL